MQTKGKNIIWGTIIMLCLALSMWLVENSHKQDKTVAHNDTTMISLKKEQQAEKKKPAKIVKKLPTMYQKARKAGEAVVAAEKVYATAKFNVDKNSNGQPVTKTKGYSKALLTIQSHVASSDSWDAVKNPWVKNPNWKAQVAYQGATHDDLYPVSFVYRNDKDEIMEIAKADYNASTDKFENVSTYLTPAGDKDGQAYIMRNWKETKVN